MTPTSKWVTHSYLTTSRSACYRSNYKYKDGWAPCLTCFMSGRPNHPYTCNSIGNILTLLEALLDINYVSWYLGPGSTMYHYEMLGPELKILFVAQPFHVLVPGTTMKCCYKRVNCSLWYLVPTCYLWYPCNKLVPGITVWTVWFTLLYQHFIAVPGTTVKLTLS